MIWTALVFTLMLIFEWRRLWKQRLWKDLSVNLTLAMLGIVMASLIQWQVWLNFDALAPVKAVFMPATKWLYNIL